MGQYQHVEGHLVGLLQIVVAANVDLSIRQVASIYLKNVSARDWMPREPGKEFYLGCPFFPVVLEVLCCHCFMLEFGKSTRTSTNLVALGAFFS